MGPVDRESLVAAIPLAAVLIAPDERIVAANDEARTLLGQGIAGRHFITVLRQPAVLDAIEATRRDGRPRKPRYLSNDGRRDVVFLVSVREVRMSDPDQAGVLVCFDDITDVEQAEQMRRDFVANVSHELRTPLTALMGFIETLKGPARNDSEAQLRFLSFMETEAGRMNRLVGDLLSLSRVEAEERVRPTTRLDLTELAAETVRSYARLADEAGVALETELADPFVMTGDPDQLRQVLSNLIENGIKYSGRGATVRVSVGAPAYQAPLRTQGCVIEISDTGVGIADIHLSRLTERFYRVDTHRSRAIGGTGLGLAIVKHIVSRHRGRMRLTSAPGEGMHFRIVLPV